MAIQPQTGLTYEDLRAFPEDNLRRELIRGELIVTAAPETRHQRVVLNLGSALRDYSKAHGGEAFVAPTDVYLAEDTVLEPDVLFVAARNLEKIEKNFVRGAPDFVIEVSSPTNRRLEIVRKKEIYERFGVPEYWYIDLDADRVEIYRLDRSSYRQPEVLGRNDSIRSPLLPGFSIVVDEMIGAADA